MRELKNKKDEKINASGSFIVLEGGPADFGGELTRAAFA